MLQTVSKLLLQHDMLCRHHVYNMHPDGPSMCFPVTPRMLLHLAVQVLPEQMHWQQLGHTD
jgi:hypothetical protein